MTDRLEEIKKCPGLDIRTLSLQKQELITEVERLREECADKSSEIGKWHEILDEDQATIATLEAALIELDNLYPNNLIIEKALAGKEK